MWVDGRRNPLGAAPRHTQFDFIGVNGQGTPKVGVKSTQFYTLDIVDFQSGGFLKSVKAVMTTFVSMTSIGM